MVKLTRLPYTAHKRVRGVWRSFLGHLHEISGIANQYHNLPPGTGGESVFDFVEPTAPLDALDLIGVAAPAPIAHLDTKEKSANEARAKTYHPPVKPHAPPVFHFNPPYLASRNPSTTRIE